MWYFQVCPAGRLARICDLIGPLALPWRVASLVCRFRPRQAVQAPQAVPIFPILITTARPHLIVSPPPRSLRRPYSSHHFHPSCLTAAMNAPIFSRAEDHDALERASWVWSVVGGVAGLATLASLVVLLGQLALVRNTMEEAKKERLLGRWRSVVISAGSGQHRRSSAKFAIANRHFWLAVAHRLRLGWVLSDEGVIGLFRASAQVPTISIKALVQGGYTMTPKAVDMLVESGWVNFLETFGVEPEDVLYRGNSEGNIGRVDRLMPSPHQAGGTQPWPFSTERVSELIERRLPMHFNGSAFVLLCAVLGFFEPKWSGQDGKPYAIMRLPALWPGPLGKIILRESPNGIVAILRYESAHQAHRLAAVGNGVERSPLAPFSALEYKTRFCIRSRAFLVAHCVPLRSLQRALFFCGPAPRTSEEEKLGELHNQASGQANANGEPSSDSVVLLYQSPHREVDFDIRGAFEVMGLLHATDYTTMATTWALRQQLPEGCVKIGRWFALPEELALMREALKNIRPDGYIFTSSDSLYRILLDISAPAAQAGASLRVLAGHLTGSSVRHTGIASQFTRQNGISVLLNEKLLRSLDVVSSMPPYVFGDGAVVQGYFKHTSRDCQVITSLYDALEGFCGGTDAAECLNWAFVVSPDLVQGICDVLTPCFGESGDALANILTGQASIKDDIFESEDLFGRGIKFPVPQANPCSEGTPLGHAFSGEQIIAGLARYVLRWLWLRGGWWTDLAESASTIPGDVFMI